MNLWIDHPSYTYTQLKRSCEIKARKKLWLEREAMASATLMEHFTNRAIVGIIVDIFICRGS